VSKRLSIFSPTIGSGLGKNVFGKDVANHSLFRALLLYGGLDQLDFLHPSGAPAQRLVASLIQETPCATKVTSNDQLAIDVARQSGTLLRGSADLINLAWDRRRNNAMRDYSLVGLIHTTAPPSIREYIGQSLIAPVMPWDAIICTSPSVQTGMTTMFNDWRDYLGARFEGKATQAPQLPLLPLGVEAKDFAKGPDTPRQRAALRAELRVGDEDILVLWVGRLSFFEKAFPQPMMVAIEAAAKLSGKRVHFAMAGWFPNGAEGERLYLTGR
jgi:D-inositol-3-phosphate glycosyltransferase